MNSKKYTVRATFVITITLLISCTPRFGNNLLTFFFDGVPSVDTTVTVTETKESDIAIGSDVFRADPVAADSILSVHYPFQEKGCSFCHDELSKSDLIMEQPDLCYSCHNDFSADYAYVHGPAAGGYCTFCHDPHSSRRIKLLKAEISQLCRECHETKYIFNNEVHRDLEDSDCAECHNPHAGDTRFLLNDKIN